MRGAADAWGISLKAIDLAARLGRRRSALSAAQVSKLVTGTLAVALAAAAVHVGLDIRWALAASDIATPGRAESPGTRSHSVAASAALQSLVSAHLFGSAPAPTEVAAQRDTTLVLTGTIARPDPSGGFALIGPSAETAHLHPVGDSLAGGAVLRAVYRDHVIVERAGELRTVFFPRGTNAALTAALIGSGQAPASDAPDDGDSGQALRQHIEDALQSESDRTAAFLRQQPFYSQGQLRGIVLEPGSDPGMLAQLGLKAGDVLEHIDRAPIADPDRLTWLREKLQSGGAVELSLMRPGVGAVEVTIPGGAVAGMIAN